jgi:hypothetical protein
VVLSFILLLSLNPESAQRAQAEMDTVIGRERIPELRDRDDLPYMEAVLQEVMRMCPVVPLGMLIYSMKVSDEVLTISLQGLSHLTTEEIEFRGYRIPKGASIDANIW